MFKVPFFACSHDLTFDKNYTGGLTDVTVEIQQIDMHYNIVPKIL